MKRLRDDVTATRLPEDATEAASEKRSLEERWLKISSYMDRLSTLAVDIKQHGRRQKQKNPAASLDHLKSQCQACERLVKARLERLGRSLVSSEFLAAARKAWTVLRRKMDEYFSQSARLGESHAVVNEQERQLIHFEDDIMVLFSPPSVEHMFFPFLSAKNLVGKPLTAARDFFRFCDDEWGS